jgi:regulatory protein
MKITDIKPQAKRQDRYSIFVDNKYAFSLSENELMNSGIRIDREYSAVELEELQKSAVLDKAYMRALDLLSRRARSEWEMRDYLKRKGYDTETTDTILNKLSKAGYIDDYKFAKAWADNRHLLKNISRRKLWQELKQKRIADDTISLVLEEDETDELAEIKKVIEKKQNQSRYKDEQKLLAYLLRQGFKYGDIKTVLSER